MKEADWKSINIASGANPDVTDGIVDPYADQSVRVKVPDLVYSQPAPYKTEVVEIGEHTLGKVNHSCANCVHMTYMFSPVQQISSKQPLSHVHSHAIPH